MEHTITFYGGINTIGGVHVLISNGRKGLVFDLGVTWAWELFGGKVVPHEQRALKHYLLTRLAPPITSIFKEDLVKDVSLTVLKDLWKVDHLPELESIDVFVSHIHQDHMALLPFLKAETKVFMHQDAYSLYKAVAQAGEYPFTEASVMPLSNLETVQLDDDFSFKMVEVDHDTPGASGLVIDIADKKIGFTGDWRRHGRHTDKVDEFIEICKQEKVDLLLTEGTTLRKETYFNEPVMREELQVAEEFGRLSYKRTGLIYTNILGRNVERVADFILKTHELGRQLIMDQKTAILWFTATREGLSYLPEDHPAMQAEKEIIRLLTFSDQDTTDLPYQTTSLSQVYAEKHRYVVYLTEDQLPLLSEFETHGDTSEKSLYFHADGNPLSSNDKTLNNWLQLYSIDYQYYATGGHASPEAISAMIEEINPKVVVPLHSNHPSIINSRGITKHCPNYGESLSIQKLLNSQRVSLV